MKNPSHSQTHLTSSNLDLFPRSLVLLEDAEYALARTGGGPQLVVMAVPEVLVSFEGERTELAGKTLLTGPCSPKNAAALRSRLDWLIPHLLGLQTSAGLGDRVGLATPGHVRALRALVKGRHPVASPGRGNTIAPIFAQQSIREMTRTGRTPQQVMDDALWGIFQEGWQEGFGADADHLKTLEDIDSCLSAGFSFFTIDPGAHVDNRAETANIGELRELAESLPVEIQPRASRLLKKSFDFEGLFITFGEATLLKAIVKYGRAVAHVASMYHHLVKAAGKRNVELEVSVDETEQPTSHAEHLYIALELKRLGVKWVSLAPRYVGRFEKGVDYIGDVVAFETDLAGHAAIARQFGPYKLSLHSGSDKFSIYPPAMRQTRGLVHLKTAGTSYLEALRTIAALDVDLFREIYYFAREHYETDRVTYHLSGEVGRAPFPDAIRDWPAVLEQFDAREILHATYGSVLTERTASGGWLFHDRIMTFLRSNGDAYAANLEKHFVRHLTSFMLE